MLVPDKGKSKFSQGNKEKLPEVRVFLFEQSRGERKNLGSLNLTMEDCLNGQGQAQPIGKVMIVGRPCELFFFFFFEGVHPARELAGLAVTGGKVN